jgi:hypothetical protein
MDCDLQLLGNQITNDIGVLLNVTKSTKYKTTPRMFNMYVTLQIKIA